MKKFIVQGAIIIMAITILDSCRKLDEFVSSENLHNSHGHLSQTKNYSSDVVLKWIDMQLRLYRTNPTPIGGPPPTRYFSYSAIALYESVVPGMPAFQSLSGQLTDMPVMPQTLPGYEYYWPECANAALAAMTRDVLPNTTDANKASVDSLENALNDSYKMKTDTAEFRRSANFGKAIALTVFNWSKTDGSANANAPYTLPVGPGLWVPTPPALAAPFGPYWGKDRLMVQNSLDGSAPPAPPVYSEDPSSDYYKMVKEEYDLFQALTPEQTATALYYRDNPGFGGAHYLGTLKSIFEQEDRKLDFTAFAFAKVSVAIIDATIGCWQQKYKYNQERPVTYIRSVLGFSTWSPLFATPNHPEYPSAHSVLAGAFSEVMKGLFGSDFHFTDHTYDYLGMAPRSFTSFDDYSQDIANARVYAGIHYRLSCDRGLQQGKIIGENINSTLKFMK